MATVKMTLREALERGGRVNPAVLDATTDEDIRRHAREDGQNPEAVHDDWFPSPAALRGRLRLTQESISRRLRIPVATWRNWEQGRVVPDPAARALLVLIWQWPGTVAVPGETFEHDVPVGHDVSRDAKNPAGRTQRG